MKKIKNNNKILSKEEIIHLANLSNIVLSKEEITKYQSQLTDTLEYIENINKLETKGVDPTSNVLDLQNVFFEDGDENKRSLKNVLKGYFTVKRVL